MNDFRGYGTSEFLDRYLGWQSWVLARRAKDLWIMDFCHVPGVAWRTGWMTVESDSPQGAISQACGCVVVLDRALRFMLP